MPFDEKRALGRTLLRMLQATFPFQHRPARVIVLRHFGEDAPEINLSIAQRTKAPGAIDPVGIAAIDPLPAIGPELGVLYMEGTDALMIDVDKRQVVQLLQQKVAGIVQDIGARVVAHGFQKTLEADSVVQVFAGMQLVADVYAGRIEGVQYGQPATRQLGKRFLHQAGWALWPGI